MKRDDRPLFHLLLHIGRLLERHVREELEPIGVPHAQGRVLSVLARHGPLTQASLARGMGVTAATTSVMLRTMEERGWIERTPDPVTGRALVVSLTPAGASLAGEVKRRWRRVEERVRKSLGKSGRHDLRPYLEELRDGLGGRAPVFETYRQGSS